MSWCKNQNSPEVLCNFESHLFSIICTLICIKKHVLALFKVFMSDFNESFSLLLNWWFFRSTKLHSMYVMCNVLEILTFNIILINGRIKSSVIWNISSLCRLNIRLLFQISYIWVTFLSSLRLLYTVLLLRVSQLESSVLKTVLLPIMMIMVYFHKLCLACTRPHLLVFNSYNNIVMNFCNKKNIFYTLPIEHLPLSITHLDIRELL